MADLKFNVDDSIIASGDIYQSANGTLTSGKVNRHIGVIDKTAPKGAHPYHIKGIGGWFNEEALKKYSLPPFNIGDKVSVLKPITYSGKTFKSWYKTYEVLSIDIDKVVIGKNGMQTTIVNAENLKKVDSKKE